MATITLPFSLARNDAELCARVWACELVAQGRTAELNDFRVVYDSALRAARSLPHLTTYEAVALYVAYIAENVKR